MNIAIIGAGLSGLVAAYSLAGIADVTTFEKSRGLGGRAATRWHDIPGVGRAFIDHGAQYIRDDSPIMHDLLHDLLPTHDLIDIGKPVWTLDGAGMIREGDPAQNAAPKWTYRQGLATLGKLIVQAGELNVKQNVRVGKIDQVRDGFMLFDDQGAALGGFDHVLIAVPSGQGAELLAASTLPLNDRETLIVRLRAVSYRRCVTVALGFARPLQPRPFYALVDTSRENHVSWLAFEHDKPGHVPPGHSVLLVQMAAEFSTEYWDRDPALVTADVAARASAILGESVEMPDWTEYHKWRYSLPDSTLNEADLNGVIPGLWFAGDYGRGGRVHLAAQSGFDVAGLLAEEIG